MSLESTVAYLRKRSKIRLEKRHPRFMFGATNYGEVPGMINEADGDPWDVFTPGLTRRLDVSKNYSVKSVLGVVLMANGNHKIAVELFVPGFDPTRVQADVEAYMRRYSEFTRVATSWRSIQEIYSSSEATRSKSASSLDCGGATAGSSLEEC